MFRTLCKPKSRRDDGLTLIELLVSITLTGLVIASLSGAIIVILRQQSDSGGRLNNARAENGAGLWIPGDLASAGQNVDTTASVNSCFGVCPANVDVGGSNALLLSWTTQVPNAAGTLSVQQVTQVSYRYVFVSGEYQLIRVQCDQVQGVVTCRKNVVLHKLDAPPGGVFTAGVTVPDWIIKVSTPPDAAAIVADPGGVAAAVKNAQRVVVTVNGGGTAATGGGGTKRISLSAGGTNRTIIASTSVQGAPNLIAARSLCGGAYTLIIDRSGSIGSTDFALVKAAVKSFVTMFVGTPVRLKLVPFDTIASTTGATAPTWTMSYNMANQTEADALLTLVTNMTYPAGYTNWDDAMFRTFLNADGTVAQDLPGTVVFFTDGVPTNSRLNNTSSTSAADPPAPLPGYSTTMDGSYQQQGFYRANLIAAQFRDTTRFIGVGVGPGVTDMQTWTSSVPGYHYNYTHSYHLQPARWYHIERGYRFPTTFSRGFHFLKWSGTAWVEDTSGGLSASTSPSASRLLSFTAPFSFFKTGLTLSARASVEQASTWTAPGTGSTNEQVMLAQNDPTLSSTDGTDGWKVTLTTNSTPFTYYYTDPTATTSTALAATSTSSVRASFSAPYSLSRDVTASATAQPNPTYSWSTNISPVQTNATLYPAFNAATLDTVSTDGWTNYQVYTSPFTYSDPVDTVGSGYSSSDPSWARSQQQFSLPYTAFGTPVTQSVTGAIILARLVSNSDTGVPATLVGGKYTNALTANMYLTPDYTNFGLALQTIALSQCGGTLTLQTKVGAVAAADPFTYQKTAITDSTGNSLISDMTVVTTTNAFTSGTFDLNISDGTFRTVQIQPSNLSSLTGYISGTWSCKAGVTPRTFTTVPIAGSPFTGISVRVAANEAVSCIQTVTR